MPTPHKGEKQKDFVSRCIPTVLKEGTAKDNKQAAAICFSMFKQKHKQTNNQGVNSMDYIFNGQSIGGVADLLLANDMNPEALRLFQDDHGRGSWMTCYNAKGEPYSKLVSNAPATLRKEEWMMIDDLVVEEAKPELKLVGELRARGLVKNIPEGMGVTVLQYQTMGDITAATISMDPMRRSERDRPEFDIVNLPLPIIHKDGWFSLREVLVSRRNGTGIDTDTIRLATRKVAEEADSLALGTAASWTYGGGTVYGLINHPNRNTKLLTDPTTPGWTGATLLAEVLDMVAIAAADNYNGPYVLLYGPAWVPYLEDDYSAAKGDNTVLDRILRISKIESAIEVNSLTGFQLVLVQMSSDVVREIVGIDIAVVQWESDGGYRLNFKVIAMLVPQVRASISGNSGIVHGNTV